MTRRLENGSNDLAVSLLQHGMENKIMQEKVRRKERPTEIVQDHFSHNPNNLADREAINLEEKRRRDYVGNMEKSEKGFAHLKENAKIEEEEEYETNTKGTQQHYILKCKELGESREHEIWAVEKWREYQKENINNICDAEKKQCEDECKSETKNIRERMMAITLAKRKRLMEEKKSMNFTYGTERGTHPLKKRGISKDQATGKRRSNPPQINYILKETEIHEDLSLIQKALSRPSKFIEHIGKSPSDVYSDKGRLNYHNQIFEKGKEVEIEAKNENGKWVGVLVVVNPAEIHIKSSDGTKSRFSMSQLRNGRFSISLSNFI